jgi:LEA14-like dessication related protein
LIQLSRIGFILLVMLMGACASIQPIFEPPAVTISSFKLLPSRGMSPQFEIGLHIVNPNLTPLALKGMSYAASIEGHRILVGASNDLPVVPSYGESDVTVTATADLLSGFKLITELMSLPREQLQYQLSVKLNVGDFLPDINVEQQGELRLGEH